MTLEQAEAEPGNNISLIRFAAASLVVFSHSFSIALGPGTAEPPAPFIPTSFGTIGVSVFFLMSGYLIARSYARRESLAAFIRARVLRIYPGLAVAVVFCVVVIGPLSTTLPLREYFGHPATLGFVTRNATLTSLTIQSTLPGAFAGNPLPSAVNDPLWTLPYELWMYAFVAVVGAAGLFRYSKVLNGLAAALAAVMVAIAFGEWPAEAALFVRLGTFFLAGVACYVNRRRIPLDARLLAVLAAGAAALYATPLFMTAFRITLGYAVLVLAFVPGGVLRRFNSFGDYSYGIYIYGFPCQQLIAASVPGIPPLAVFAGAMAMTLPLAMLSWTFIERPALALKGRAPASERRVTSAPAV